MAQMYQTRESRTSGRPCAAQRESPAGSCRISPDVCSCARVSDGSGSHAKSGFFVFHRAPWRGIPRDSARIRVWEGSRGGGERFRLKGGNANGRRGGLAARRAKEAQQSRNSGLWRRGRLRLATSTARYLWSSAPARFGDPDASTFLGQSLWQTCYGQDAWRAILTARSRDEALEKRIRDSTRTGRPLGDESFLARLDSTYPHIRPNNRGPKPKPATHTATAQGVK